MRDGFRTTVRMLGLLAVLLAAPLSASAGADADVSRRVADAVVSVVFANGLGTWRGSGFAIGDGRWIVTCRHVVSLDAGSGRRLTGRQVLVLSPWVGEGLAAEVAAVDEGADLALLRLEQPGLPALPLAGEAEHRKLLDLAPPPRLGIAGFTQPSEGEAPDATVGSRQREGLLMGERTQEGVTYLVLQPTPEVGKGWSGGPLFRPETGEVVGVFQALIARAGEPEVWFPQAIAAARVEALLRHAGVTDLTPFRAPPAPALPRAEDAEALFRHEYRAAALSVTREWAQVEAERRALLKLRPGSARAYNGLGVALEAQHRHEEALAAFAESLRLDPKRPRTHANRGRVLHELGRLKEAEEALRDGLELAPDDAEAWVALGRVLAAQRRREEALEAMQQAVRLSPNHPIARWNLGISLVQMERMDEGIVELREAVALSANFPPLRLMRLNLAQVLQAAGRLDAAETEYRAVLRTADDNATAHLLFAHFLRLRGKTGEALVHARRCLALKPPQQLERAARSLLEALGEAK